MTDVNAMNERWRTPRNHSADQRGIVLVSALVLALLYFALMELMMLDASRSLSEAQRYRSHVIAATLAESGAELAAKKMIGNSFTMASLQDPQGSMSGSYVRNGCCNFEISGKATTTGVPTASAQVHIQGRIQGNTISIDYATHSQ